MSGHAELAALRRARAARLAAEAAETRAVVDARLAGVRWEDIAVELEMQQPNAVRKYKRLVEERLREGPRDG
ncbi:hypothetical protein [Actinomadura meridiana]|uniref:hypothetical protein n=1 Tax=Actinomadura meridiana TaxID=559626 RepID=UPI0031E6E5DD